MKATQQMVIDRVVEYFRHAPQRMDDDLPAIRTALNDRMDYYEKEGHLSRSVSNRWNQQRMVKAVQRGLK